MAPEPRNITPAGKTYTVVKGDSLSKIAKREYGDANKWRQIFEANKDVIDNPDLIEPGQNLIIPER
jgi:nucleoid-associated protein YgaU